MKEFILSGEIEEIYKGSKKVFREFKTDFSRVNSLINCLEFSQNLQQNNGDYRFSLKKIDSVKRCISEYKLELENLGKREVVFQLRFHLWEEFKSILQNMNKKE